MANPALVQQVTGTATASTTCSATLSQPVAAGSRLFAIISMDEVAVNGGDMTGGGAEWSKLMFNVSDESTIEFWFGRFPTGGVGGDVTIMLDGVANAVMNVMEWSGDWAEFMDTSGANAITSNTITTADPFITTHVASELIIGGANWDGALPTSGPTNGFAALTTVSLGTFRQVASYKIVSATGNYVTGWGTAAPVVWGSGMVSVAFTPSDVIGGGGTVGGGSNDEDDEGGVVMAAPFKQTLTVAVGALRSGGCKIENVDVRSVEFVSGSNLTGTWFYLEGASIADASGARGNQPAEASYSEIFDSTGARVQFDCRNGKIVVLTADQRAHFKGAHYIRIVASAPQASAAGSVNIIGVTMYR